MSRLLSPRSLVLMLVSLPIAAVILGIMACLPVPVGDPETSKVDAKFTGAWLLPNPGDNKDDENKRQLYVVAPWDSRTYLVRFFEYEEKDGKIEAGKSGSYKAWLTPIAGQTFVTLDPKPIGRDLGTTTEHDPFFVVGKLTTVENGLELLLTDPDKGLLKDVKTREQAEGIIKDHVSDPEIFAKGPMKFQKLDADKTKAVLEAFHVE